MKLVAEPLYGYYMGFFANVNPTGGDISILLITNETHPVQYYIEAPGVGYYRNGTVSVGDEVILNLPRSIQVSSVYHQNNGIYLTTSSDNVTVIGQNLYTYSSDSFFALPLIELGDEYVYYGISVSRFHSNNVNSSILIVGTENNTMMKLTVTQSVNIGVGNNITTLTPGIEYSFVINRLQTVYIGSPEDLSGTKIVTNKPVSVFSGHQCGNVPWDIGACDHLIEQIPPTALWGKVFYITPLANKTSYTIKTLAAYNSTTINVYCNNTMESYTINEGEFINTTSQINEYCAIYSNKELLVVQLSHGGQEDNGNGDPMMTLVPATNQYLNKFDFSTIHKPGFNHYVNIIVKEQYYQPNMIYLIAGGVNRSLDTQQWVPIEVNSITEAYATQVNISEGVTQIFHTDASAQMMTIVYGFNFYDACGHIGGFHIPTGYLIIVKLHNVCMHVVILQLTFLLITYVHRMLHTCVCIINVTC